jgi:hypothetical protein
MASQPPLGRRAIELTEVLDLVELRHSASRRSSRSRNNSSTAGASYWVQVTSIRQNVDAGAQSCWRTRVRRDDVVDRRAWNEWPLMSYSADRLRPLREGNRTVKQKHAPCLVVRKFWFCRYSLNEPGEGIPTGTSRPRKKLTSQQLQH